MKFIKLTLYNDPYFYHNADTIDINIEHIIYIKPDNFDEEVHGTLYTKNKVSITSGGILSSKREYIENYVEYAPPKVIKIIRSSVGLIDGNCYRVLHSVDEIQEIIKNV